MESILKTSKRHTGRRGAKSVAGLYGFARLSSKIAIGSYAFNDISKSAARKFTARSAFAGAQGATRGLLHGRALDFAHSQGALLKIESRGSMAQLCCRGRMCCGRRIAA